MTGVKDFKRGCLLVFAAGTLWGTIGLFVKQMEKSGSSPVTTSFLRVFFAALIMFVICVARSGFRSLRVSRKTLLFCILLGVICHGVYNILYSLAVTLAGVSFSAVLLNIAPVFTLLFSALFFSEQITGMKMTAIFVNILGCVLTVTNGSLDTAAFSAAGILCGIGAGLCYAMTAVFGRFAAERTDPFVMSLYSYSAAALLLLFWAHPRPQDIAADTGILLWGFLFALIPTSAAYILYYRGVREISESSRVPVIASVETVVATLIGITIYRERLGAVSILGVLLVLGSILLMNLFAQGSGQNMPGRKRAQK